MRNSNGEGYIGKTKDGRWVARIQQGYKPDGKPQIKALYGKTQKEVRQKLKDYKNSEEREVAEPEDFGDYLVNWFQLYKKNDLKASTYDKYEDLINKHILPQIGHLHISVLNVDHLQKFFNYMVEKQYSEDYAKKAKYLLDGCLKLAEFNEVVAKNPMKGVKFPRKAAFPMQKEIKFLNEDDIQKLKVEASSMHTNNKPVYRYGQAIIFILFTGLRCGEALNLKWKDIDLEKKVVRVTNSVTVIKNRNKISEDCPAFITVPDSQTKTKGSVRGVYLSKSAIEAIIAHKEVINPSNIEERIFATKTGSILSKRNLHRAVVTISSKANLSIPNCSVHELRHTFASMVFRQGVDIKTVSALLGHSSVKLTYDIYVHLLEEQKKEAVSLLDSL